MDGKINFVETFTNFFNRINSASGEENDEGGNILGFKSGEKIVGGRLKTEHDSGHSKTGSMHIVVQALQDATQRCVGTDEGSLITKEDLQARIVVAAGTNGSLQPVVNEWNRLTDADKFGTEHGAGSGSSQATFVDAVKTALGFTDPADTNAEQKAKIAAWALLSLRLIAADGLITWMKGDERQIAPVEVLKGTTPEAVACQAEIRAYLNASKDETAADMKTPITDTVGVYVKNEDGSTTTEQVSTTVAVPDWTDARLLLRKTRFQQAVVDHLVAAYKAINAEKLTFVLDGELDDAGVTVSSGSMAEDVAKALTDQIFPTTSD
jgi:hypothetical protein